MQVAAEMYENGNNRGRSNTNGTNNINEDDGMQSYSAKTGYIEVRFMTGNSQGFNVSRALVSGSSEGEGQRIYDFALGRYWQ
jgi:hypothetical protein